MENIQELLTAAHRSSDKMSEDQIKSNKDWYECKANLPDLHLWHECYQSVCRAAKNTPYNQVAAQFPLHNPLSVERNCFFSEVENKISVLKTHSDASNCVTRVLLSPSL